MKACPKCWGDGWCDYAVKGEGGPWEQDTCDVCDGTGEIEEDQE
jgi:DnaJ-class molecular chaperone